MKKITKVLSPNDTGETGGHQAGILVPKDERILSFFPDLDDSVKNPRIELRFIDQSGDEWSFSFIYYNNKYFGGTRNEYRLTGMTRYFKANQLRSGDTVVLSQNGNCEYTIMYLRSGSELSSTRERTAEGKVKLKVSTQWVAIDF